MLQLQLRFFSFELLKAFANDDNDKGLWNDIGILSIEHELNAYVIFRQITAQYEKIQLAN